MKKKSIIIGIAFICLLIGIRLFGFDRLVTFEQFTTHRDWLLQTIAKHYTSAVFGYIGLFIGTVACSLPAVLLLTVLGGFCFGMVPGMIYANISATIGSVISYFFVRYSLGDLFAHKYQSSIHNPMFSQFKQHLYRYGSWYLLAVHQIVFIPFGLVNIMAGIMQVPVWTFVWTTIVGIIPAQALFTYVGSTCAHIDSLQDLFSPVILAVMILASAVTLSGFVLHVRSLRK